jgi:hypothetical protein
MNPSDARERRLNALRDLARPTPRPGTNAAALRSLGRLARACEWEPDAERPARLRDRFHALASAVMGQGERRLRVCEKCLHRTSARHYARVAPLQLGRILREAVR